MTSSVILVSPGHWIAAAHLSRAAARPSPLHGPASSTLLVALVRAGRCHFYSWRMPLFFPITRMLHSLAKRSDAVHVFI